MLPLRPGIVGCALPHNGILGHIMTPNPNMCLDFAIMNGQSYQPTSESKKRKVTFLEPRQLNEHQPFYDPKFGIKSSLRKKPIGEKMDMHSDSDDPDEALEPSQLDAYETRNPVTVAKLPGRQLRKRILKQIHS